MRSSVAAWLVLWCVLPLGCGDTPKIMLPDGTSRDPASDGTGAQNRSAVCDQATDGTPCGLELHCIFNACVANACGDGIAAEPEACDDGNERDHDGCDARCRLEVEPGCGNGVVEPREECDELEASLTCTAVCTRPTCGDDILSPGEQCDDGNTSDSDRCDSQCREQTIILPDASVPGMDMEADAGTLYIDAGDSLDAGGVSSPDASGVPSPDAGTSPTHDAGPVELDAGTQAEVDAGPRPLLGIAQARPACEQCRNDNCREYQGLVDAVSLCFANADPVLVQECVDVMDCAYTNDCGYNAIGLSECFCGTADLGACQAAGAANGPCRSEIYAAAHTNVLAEVIARFGDASLPIGAANYLEECDQALCPACLP